MLIASIRASVHECISVKNYRLEPIASFSSRWQGLALPGRWPSATHIEPPPKRRTGKTESLPKPTDATLGLRILIGARNPALS